MNTLDAIKKLKECQDSCDTERAHREADEVLCELLTSLGYEDVVKEYEQIEKWFD